MHRNPPESAAAGRSNLLAQLALNPPKIKENLWKSMKINEISLLGLLAPIWLALGLQFVLFLQPGSLLPHLAASWLALVALNPPKIQENL